MAYIRQFKTGSDATGVQVCYKERGKVVKVVHVGSANSEEGLVKLLKKAQGIIDAERVPLFDLGKFEVKNRREMPDGRAGRENSAGRGHEKQKKRVEKA